MHRRFVLTLLALLLVLALAACAEEQPQEAEETPAGTETAETAEEAATAEETTVEATNGEATETTAEIAEGTTAEVDGEQVSVGGFVVESQDTPETTVPEVTVSRSDAQEYLDQVQPIVEDSVQDVSSLAQPEVRVENGSLTLDLPLDRLESTRDDLRDGLDELRQIDPPPSLEPINEQLIEAYERTLPAYTEIIEAADSGDVGRINEAVQENLPRIERFNAEARAILQDLERAAGEQ